MVAATNADLEREIEAGRFRADLFDRLRFSVIHLPPLRERREDLGPLIEYFTTELCREVASIAPRSMSPAALRCVQAYGWPGNVRELKFAVERALCVARGGRIEAGDLPPEVRGDGGAAARSGGFDAEVREKERNLLIGALKSSGGSQKDAARGLGLTYDRFRHLLRKHGLVGGQPDC